MKERFTILHKNPPFDHPLHRSQSNQLMIQWWIHVRKMNPSFIWKVQPGSRCPALLTQPQMFCTVVGLQKSYELSILLFIFGWIYVWRDRTQIVLSICISTPFLHQYIGLNYSSNSPTLVLSINSSLFPLFFAKSLTQSKRQKIKCMDQRKSLYRNPLVIMMLQSVLNFIPHQS